MHDFVGDYETPVTPCVYEVRNERRLKENETKDLLKIESLTSALQKRPEIITNANPRS